MGKRRQRRNAEMAADAAALAEEAMVVWRVMSWYREGAEPVYGAPLRCPECGALSLVLRVDGREGLARNRCTECDHEFLVSERAMDAVLSGNATRPSGMLLPGELVPPGDSTDPGTADPVTADPGVASSPADPHASSPGSPAPVTDPPMTPDPDPVDATTDEANRPAVFGPVIVTDGDGTIRTVHPGSVPAPGAAVTASPSTTTPEPATPPGTGAPSTSLFSARPPTVTDEPDTLAGAHPGATPPLRILLVEDDPGDAALIEAVLARPGPERFEVRVASTRRDGEDLAQTFVPDVVLLDLDLPDSHGLATITRWCFSDLPGTVIVMSGDYSEQIEAQGLEHGVAEFLPKAHLTALVDADDAAVEEALALLTTERDAIH